MARIFINYRREDTAGWAGRLFDRLNQKFGRENVFMDIDTLEPGVDFVEAIQEAVGSCDVLIAVIGQKWLTVTNPEGQRRLNNPEDFVRLEIATALERKVRVIPILVDRAFLPHYTELPDVLQPLVRRHALEVGNHFHSDVDRLIRAIELIRGIERGSIFLVRHAEEALNTQDPSLTAEGRARADSLAQLLKDAGIQAIYTAEDRCARETATPLARMLDLQVTVLPHGEPTTPLNRVVDTQTNVLVVGHTVTIHQILQQLGVQEPIFIADNEYDNLFIIPPGPDPVLIRQHFD
jgi:phosphohistidine phosphatase SixA